MSKVTIELNSEMIDTIITDELFRSRSNLLEDFQSGTASVFDIDPVEDRKQIGEMIKALEKVIDWYSVPGIYEFDELPEVEDVPAARDLGN